MANCCLVANLFQALDQRGEARAIPRQISLQINRTCLCIPRQGSTTSCRTDFRTKGGLRLLATHAPFQPDDPSPREQDYTAAGQLRAMLPENLAVRVPAPAP